MSNKKVDIKAVKDFIIGTTHNINKKISELETKYNIHIKLRPLPKKVDDIGGQDEENIIFPMSFQNRPIKVNTGYRGTIPSLGLNTFSPSFDGSFFNDFINGVDGENYLERLFLRYHSKSYVSQRGVGGGGTVGQIIKSYAVNIWGPKKFVLKDISNFCPVNILNPLSFF